MAKQRRERTTWFQSYFESLHVVTGRAGALNIFLSVVFRKLLARAYQMQLCGGKKSMQHENREREFTQLHLRIYRPCWQLHGEIVSRVEKKRHPEVFYNSFSQCNSCIFIFSLFFLSLSHLAYRSPFIFLLGLSVLSFFSGCSSPSCSSFRFFDPLNTPLACTLPSTGSTFTA